MQRVSKIVLALLLGCVLCEGGLRLVAWTNGRLRSRRGAEPFAEERVWVCIGDSNTYGVFEDEQDAYPAALERLLASHAEGPPIRVVNLGLPAINGRQADTALEEALARYHPELVLILVGANNVWSWSSEELSYQAPPWYEELRLTRLLRLFRFALSEHEPRLGIDALRQVRSEDSTVMVGADRAGRSVSYDTSRASGARPASATAASIRLDLQRLMRRLEAPSRAQPAWSFLTYAYDEGGLRAVNEAIREAARALDAPLIDAGARLAPAREAFTDPELFYPDRHPRALGYELFARVVYAGLRERSLVRGAPAELVPGDRRATARLAAPTLRWAPGAALPELELAPGESGRPFLVVLSTDAPEEPAVLSGVTLAVRDDAVFRENLFHPLLFGTTDAKGSAVVPLARLAEHPEALAGRRFLAGYVLYQSAQHLRIRAVSEAVAFTAR